MFLCATEQICHLLLSAGLDYVVDCSEPWNIFDTINSPNQDYAGFQLWFTSELDLVLASGAIPLQVKDSDETKLVIRQGPIHNSCEWFQRLTRQHSPRDRPAVHVPH